MGVWVGGSYGLGWGCLGLEDAYGRFSGSGFVVVAVRVGRDCTCSGFVGGVGIGRVLVCVGWIACWSGLVRV